MQQVPLPQAHPCAPPGPAAQLLAADCSPLLPAGPVAPAAVAEALGPAAEDRKAAGAGVGLGGGPQAARLTYDPQSAFVQDIVAAHARASAALLHLLRSEQEGV